MQVILGQRLPAKLKHALNGCNSRVTRCANRTAPGIVIKLRVNFCAFGPLSLGLADELVIPSPFAINVDRDARKLLG